MRKNVLVKATMLFASVAVFISCKDEQTIEIDRSEVKFSSNINMTSVRTRASDITWDPNDAIGVYMYEENTQNIVEGKENIRYVTEAGGEKGSFQAANTVIYFPDNGNKVRFMAYYPHREDLLGNNDVYAVDVASQSSQQVIDLLYSFDSSAKFDKTTPGKKVALSFDHQLTKVYVNVMAGEGLVDSDLQDIIVSFDGLNTKAYFNLTDGTLGNSGVPAEIALRPTFAKNGYVTSFEAIVLPTETIPAASIVFDLNDGDSENNVESDVFIWKFDNVLNKSTRYTYNVTINRSGIVVEATINDWIASDDANVNAE